MHTTSLIAQQRKLITTLTSINRSSNQSSFVLSLSLEELIIWYYLIGRHCTTSPLASFDSFFDLLNYYIWRETNIEKFKENNWRPNCIISFIALSFKLLSHTHVTPARVVSLHVGGALIKWKSKRWLVGNRSKIDHHMFWITSQTPPQTKW